MEKCIKVLNTTNKRAIATCPLKYGPDIFLTTLLATGNADLCKLNVKWF